LLKTKGMLLRPKQLKKETVEEEEMKVWDHLKDWEQEAEEEEETQRKPFSTEIVIPMTYITLEEMVFC
jgi:hypothetical protein